MSGFSRLRMLAGGKSPLSPRSEDSDFEGNLVIHEPVEMVATTSTENTLKPKNKRKTARAKKLALEKAMSYPTIPNGGCRPSKRPRRVIPQRVTIDMDALFGTAPLPEFFPDGTRIMTQNSDPIMALPKLDECGSGEEPIQIISDGSNAQTEPVASTKVTQTPENSDGESSGNDSSSSVSSVSSVSSSESEAEAIPIPEIAKPLEKDEPVEDAEPLEADIADELPEAADNAVVVSDDDWEFVPAYAEVIAPMAITQRMPSTPPSPEIVAPTAPAARPLPVRPTFADNNERDLRRPDEVQKDRAFEKSISDLNPLAIDFVVVEAERLHSWEGIGILQYSNYAVDIIIWVLMSLTAINYSRVMVGQHIRISVRLIRALAHLVQKHVPLRVPFLREVMDDRFVNVNRVAVHALNSGDKLDILGPWIANPDENFIHTPLAEYLANSETITQLAAHINVTLSSKTNTIGGKDLQDILKYSNLSDGLILDILLIQIRKDADREIKQDDLYLPAHLFLTLMLNHQDNIKIAEILGKFPISRNAKWSQIRMARALKDAASTMDMRAVASRFHTEGNRNMTKSYNKRAIRKGHICQFN